MSFRFKQFTIAQDKCAMKVNTDGVLLGAWADVNGAANILDIGTGTGVIALMMAQKNSRAIIDAIDIDEGAYIQAEENFAQSAWRNRLKSIRSSLQDFSRETKYDVIISNPPYFIDDYKTENHQMNIAKHSLALTHVDLLKGINRLLSATGKAFVVLPIFNLELLAKAAEKERLFPTKFHEVIAVKGKKPYLALVRLERRLISQNIADAKTPYGTIEIQDEAGTFTQQYKELTKEFYLKF